VTSATVHYGSDYRTPRHAPRTVNSTQNSTTNGSGNYSKALTEAETSASGGEYTFFATADNSSSDTGTSTSKLNSTSTAVGTEQLGENSSRDFDTTEVFAENRSGNYTNNWSLKTSSTSNSSTSNFTSAETTDHKDDGNSDWTKDVTSSTSSTDGSVAGTHKSDSNNTTSSDKGTGTYASASKWAKNVTDGAWTTTSSGSDESSGTTTYKRHTDTTSKYIKDGSETGTKDGITKTADTATTSDDNGTGNWKSSSTWSDQRNADGTSTSSATSASDNTNDGTSKTTFTDTSTIYEESQTPPEAGDPTVDGPPAEDVGDELGTAALVVTKTVKDSVAHSHRNGDGTFHEESHTQSSTVDGASTGKFTSLRTDDGNFDGGSDETTNVTTTTRSGQGSYGTSTTDEVTTKTNSGTYSSTSARSSENFADGTSTASTSTSHDENGSFLDQRAPPPRGTRSRRPGTTAPTTTARRTTPTTTPPTGSGSRAPTPRARPRTPPPAPTPRGRQNRTERHRGADEEHAEVTRARTSLGRHWEGWLRPQGPPRCQSEPITERGIAMASKGSRPPAPDVYTIQPIEHDYFFAGAAPDGRKALLGLLGDKMIAVFFDRDGNFVDHEQRDLPFELPQNPFAPEVHERQVRALRSWQSELGFQPGAIKVRRFEVPDVGVAINQRPESYQEFLDDPEEAEPDEEERESFMKEVQTWDDEGMFILQWGKEYWMSRDGSIHST
jgi:hypothetical protein